MKTGATSAPLVVLLVLTLWATPSPGQGEYTGRGAVGAMNSVYRLACPDLGSAATAFGHRSGKVITAGHVVKNCEKSKIVLRNSSGETAGVSEVIVDADRDRALLTTTSKFVKASLSITTESKFTMGAQVSTWGYPEGYAGPLALLSVGHLAGVEEQRSPSGKVVRKWVVNGAFNRGNSGGPLLDTRQAAVIGIISSKLAPMSKELAAALVKLKRSSRPEDKDIAKLIEHLRNQTQLVIGFATMTKDLRAFLVENGIEP